MIIGATFLYQLMGFPAFAGFLVLVAAAPLNSTLTKRGIKISRGTLGARDARMAVLNELISEVKFIKFFAWEDRWITRALKARGKELNWLIRERLNSIVFYLLWMLSPVCVSIVSFTVFVVTGGKLTVSVAFTAIQLFNMIKMWAHPLSSCVRLILIRLKQAAQYHPCVHCPSTSDWSRHGAHQCLPH